MTYCLDLPSSSKIESSINIIKNQSVINNNNNNNYTHNFVNNKKSASNKILESLDVTEFLVLKANDSDCKLTEVCPFFFFIII